MLVLAGTADAGGVAPPASVHCRTKCRPGGGHPTTNHPSSGWCEVPPDVPADGTVPFCTRVYARSRMKPLPAANHPPKHPGTSSRSMVYVTGNEHFHDGGGYHTPGLQGPGVHPYNMQECVCVGSRPPLCGAQGHSQLCGHSRIACKVTRTRTPQGRQMRC